MIGDGEARVDHILIDKQNPLCMVEEVSQVVDTTELFGKERFFCGSRQESFESFLCRITDLHLVPLAE